MSSTASGLHRHACWCRCCATSRRCAGARAHHHQGGIEFVSRPVAANVAGTLTAHHLLMNRNALFAGGIRPHHYCLPVLKRETHRRALVAAAISGSPKFFLGTDSAPHARKHQGGGLRLRRLLHGATPASSCMPKSFDAAGALDKLEAFASFHGAGLLRPAAQSPGRKTRTLRITTTSGSSARRVECAREVRQATADHESGWRKVRAPQGRMPANGRAQQVERPKATDSATERYRPSSQEPARVKWWGKSPPRTW
jgi:hypothetical protein